MKLKNAGMLFLAAFIWGIAFVAQSVGMDYVGPFTFNGIRSLIGSGFLLFVIVVRDRLIKKKDDKAAPSAPAQKDDRRVMWLGGLVCGIFLTAASTLQQMGLIYTTVGKAGFLTALYIILVPILGIFFKKKVGLIIWLSVLISAAGLYLLCMKESLHLQFGDLLMLLCAVLFAGHILVVDYYSPKVDGVKLSCIQFLVCGVICTTLMLLFESPSVAACMEAAVPILYAGICSCGIAYTAQIVGQKGMNPTVCSLILSLESVISAIAGFLILHQKMTVRELAGCGLMFTAIILAQVQQNTSGTDT